MIGAVAVAKGPRGDLSVQRFVQRYPGTIGPSHPSATARFPAWARWQHFFNLFPPIFIIRSGVQMYWTRHSTPGQGLAPDPEAGSY